MLQGHEKFAGLKGVYVLYLFDNTPNNIIIILLLVMHVQCTLLWRRETASDVHSMISSIVLYCAYI